MCSTPLQCGATQSEEPFLHGTHPVFDAGSGWIVNADGSGFAGCDFLQPDASALFGKGGDAGDGFPGKQRPQFLQQGGFAAAAVSGEEEMPLTAQLKKSDDRSGG